MNQRFPIIAFLRYIVPLLTITCAVVLGLVLGLSAGVNKNISYMQNVGRVNLSIPTKIYDDKNEIITEFFGEERREIINYNQIPRRVVMSLLSREDASFYYHNGFSFIGTARAFAKILQKVLLGSGYVSGGSTLTQQVSGHLYADRRQQTSSRKLRELWWAWQLEKYLTKGQILEIYLNKMPFGHNTYGIQAASRFFYGHGIETANEAESIMLAIQLSNPSGRYSPIKNPKRAKIIQTEIMNQMVSNGFISDSDAKKQMAEYWDLFDWSRSSGETAFLSRQDKAPYFSEYIRELLGKILSGKRDIYTDGYQVYTTLDVNYQQYADEEVNRGLKQASERLRENAGDRYSYVNKMYIPMVDMIALHFNMPKLRIPQGQNRRFAMDYYNREVNTLVDISSMMFGFDRVYSLAQTSSRMLNETDTAGRIQSALVTLEQSTGHVKALIGGRRFDRLDQLNRAVNAKIMPGSSFKPLYYSEAIASGRLTAASSLDNYAKGWINEDGSYYVPTNYDGMYSNDGIRLRKALALSLNIPAISVLETVGFDAAISRASKLMGITDLKEIQDTFPRLLSLALGIIGIAPIKMAQAFATIANYGQAVDPVAIKYITDKNGQLIKNVEFDAKRMEKMNGVDSEVLSPAAASIMIDIMRDGVRNGTLYWAYNNTRHEEPRTDIPLAGKTGTSQNWADAWAIGFSPYYTTAVWLGFDRGGQTLGKNNEASSSAAYVFMRYMKKIHDGLPNKEFEKRGLLSVAYICDDTGMLPTPSCPHTVSEIFLPGTAPVDHCDIHSSNYMGNKASRSSLSDLITDYANSKDPSTEANINDEINPLQDYDLSSGLESIDDIMSSSSETQVPKEESTGNYTSGTSLSDTTDGDTSDINTNSTTNNGATTGGDTASSSSLAGDNLYGLEPLN